MANTDPVLCFGEMLLRLSSPVGEMLLQSPRLEACFGGAEANVAVSLARLGQPSAMLTVLPDNAIGRAARAAIMAQGVDASRVVFTAGRMGQYFLTPGAVVRASDIIYDRAGSAFAQADLAALEWPALLKGVGWLHVSGVTAAIGQNGADGARAAMAAATAAGAPCSFDGNFRAKLWAQWQGDAPTILRELFSHAELAFADERDIGLIIGDAFEAAEPIERRRAAAEAAFAAFPRLQRMACTLRTSQSADSHALSAVMFHRGQAETHSPLRQLHGVIDRIGTGDAFAAGLLFALLDGRSDQAALDFALAAACLKHSMLGDFNLAGEAEVQAVMSEGFDVRR